MITHYETTIIVTPVLTDEDLKKSAKKYAEYLKSNGANIVHEDSWGLRPLAYPIDKKTTGFYHSFEFTLAEGVDIDFIGKLELAMKRDEDLLRFLTVRLDKYAIEYNDKKRKGLIGRKKEESAEAEKETVKEA